MNRQRCGWLLLVGIGWLAAGPPLPAQNPSSGGVSPEMRERSHIRLPSGSSSRSEAEKLIKERLGQAEDVQDIYKLLEEILKNLPEEERKRLLDAAGKEGPLGPVPPDPEKLRKLLQELTARQKNLPADQRKLDPQVEGMVEKLLDKAGRPQRPARPSDRPSPNRESPPPASKPAPERPAPSARESPPSPAPGKDLEFRGRLLEFVERYLQSIGRDSPALRRAGEELTRRRLIPAGEGLPLSKERESLRSRLPELGRSLRLDRMIKEGEWLFSFRSLDFGSGRGGRSFAGAPPSTRRPSQADAPHDGAPGWQALIALLVGAVLLALLGKVLAGQHSRRSSGQAAGWKLGRWPVDPAKVATRQDLVRAFEYLTLLCLGPAARCWNHLDIAAGLESGHSERRQAAAQLANLYEQARYAPPADHLAAVELVAARRHLSFLAGVSAA